MASSPIRPLRAPRLWSGQTGQRAGLLACLAFGVALIGCSAPEQADSAYSPVADARDEQRHIQASEDVRAAAPPTTQDDAGPNGRPARPADTGTDRPGPSGQGNAPAAADPRFLGTDSPCRAGVVDFEARGNLPLADAGRIVADKIGPRLSPGRFILLERSQMARIRDEQDHQSSGPISLERQLAFGRAANVSHLVLGSVAQVEGITIDARLVEVATARVVRQASAGLDSFAELERALDELAAVLNADDQEYARIEESRLERQREARDVEPTVRPVGSYLEIKFRLAARGKSELSLIREARQRARDLYAEYCQQGSGRRMTKSELVDFCREHEQIEDVRTIGYKKEFVFLVPPPG